uniref:Uncharacterized protein n=1 Tax=Podoviridae sp. ct8Lf7 TaxID=2827723 RepID=A0A8S5S176_9CAUD|nr:MAG TPA: hypothetical protein [Podoviridae sp. ct8Lf7]
MINSYSYSLCQYSRNTALPYKEISTDILL